MQLPASASDPHNVRFGPESAKDVRKGLASEVGDALPSTRQQEYHPSQLAQGGFSIAHGRGMRYGQNPGKETSLEVRIRKVKRGGSRQSIGDKLFVPEPRRGDVRGGGDLGAKSVPPCANRETLVLFSSRTTLGYTHFNGKCSTRVNADSGLHRSCGSLMPTLVAAQNELY